MSEKGRRRNGKSSWVQKGWQNAREVGTPSREGCRDCSRLPEKKTRIRGETFEDKKKKGNGGEIVVIARWRLPAERKSTRVQERKEKEGIR